MGSREIFHLSSLMSGKGGRVRREVGNRDGREGGRMDYVRLGGMMGGGGRQGRIIWTW